MIDHLTRGTPQGFGADHAPDGHSPLENERAALRAISEVLILLLSSPLPVGLWLPCHRSRRQTCALAAAQGTSHTPRGVATSQGLAAVDAN